MWNLMAITKPHSSPEIDKVRADLYPEVRADDAPLEGEGSVFGLVRNARVE